MTKEFVPYAESLELKELGFDEPCLGAWAEHGFMTPNDVSTLQDDITIEDIENTQDENMCLSPLYQQAFRWFREKHDMKFHIRQDTWNNWCKVKMILENDEYVDIDEFESYEKAELACLRKLIELVKNK